MILVKKEQYQPYILNSKKDFLEEILKTKQCLNFWEILIMEEILSQIYSKKEKFISRKLERIKTWS